MDTFNEIIKNHSDYLEQLEKAAKKNSSIANSYREKNLIIKDSKEYTNFDIVPFLTNILGMLMAEFVLPLFQCMLLFIKNKGTMAMMNYSVLQMKPISMSMAFDYLKNLENSEPATFVELANFVFKTPSSVKALKLAISKDDYKDFEQLLRLPDTIKNPLYRIGFHMYWMSFAHIFTTHIYKQYEENNFIDSNRKILTTCDLIKSPIPPGALPGLESFKHFNEILGNYIASYKTFIASVEADTITMEDYLRLEAIISEAQECFGRNINSWLLHLYQIYYTFCNNHSLSTSERRIIISIYNNVSNDIKPLFKTAERYCKIHYNKPFKPIKEIILSNIDTKNTQIWLEAMPYIAHAEENGYIQNNGDCLLWVKLDSNALFDYFLGRLFCGDYSEFFDNENRFVWCKGEGGKMPCKDINKIFGIKNAGQYRRKRVNDSEAPPPPDSFEDIDALFGER